MVAALAVALTVIVGFGADEIRERLELGLDPVESPGFFVLTRSDVLSTSWDLIQEKPALGHGLGAFAPVFATSTPRRDGFHWEHGYSDPVELAVELGLAGVALQLIVLALIAFDRRELRAWIAFAMPLAIVWAHSWVRSPLRMPALVLVALALLAMLPSSRRRRSAIPAA